MIRYLSKNNPNYEITDLNIQEQSAQNETITFDYLVNDKTGVHIHNEKYFINTDFGKEFNGGIIDTTKRKQDLFLPYKLNLVKQDTLFIPENMQVEYLPENFLIERDNYRFQIFYSQPETNLICYRKELIIFKPLIQKELFSQWNEDINKLKVAHGQQIILKSK